MSAALGVIDDARSRTNSAATPPARVVLFTGHMLDAPDRPSERVRFPATSQAEARARQLIEEAVLQQCGERRDETIAIAGAACGGDILFLEVCQSLGIRTQIYLAMPQNLFQVASVDHGGPRWVEKYRRLLEQHEADGCVHVLQDGKTIPSFLVEQNNYDVWQRSNLWMMFTALASGSHDLILLALYNADLDPNGRGGTRHLVEEAGRRGFKCVPLNARELLDTIPPG